MGYNPKKAAQTIAYLAIKNSKRPLDVLKAVKLVYLADRLSIQKFGFPIQDETRVSMPHGPVNSETYSCIQGEREEYGEEWAEVLRDREDHKVGLTDRSIDADDLDELSEADLEVLDEVWQNFGAMDKWALRDWTHNPNNIPEWEDPSGSKTRIPIVRVLNMLGIENAADHAEKMWEMDSVDSKFKEFGTP